MSNGAKVAMAVGAGYMLGRTKKMRLALMLAAAGVTGKFPTTPTALVARGLKSLGANADVGQLTEQLRSELLNAGRAAALSAATHQIDSLNDRLQGVTSAVGVDETLDEVGGTLDDVGGLVGGRKRRRTRSDDDDYVDEDDAYDEQDDEDDEEPLDVDEVDEDEEDMDEDEDVDDDLEDEDEEPEEELEPPVTRRRAAKRPSTPRKSVQATKRSAARSTSRRGR